MATTLPVDPNSAATSPQMQTDDPSSPSSDYSRSAPFWKMVSDVLEGVEAMRAAQNAGAIGGPSIQLQNVPSQSFAAMRGIEIQSPYLPKFPNEPVEEYNRRRMNAFLTNIYDDISTNLSSKPFSKTCELAPDTKQNYKDLSMNVDGLGNNLHVFARDGFKVAMDKGITWILCDYTNVPPNTTLADERDMGARPYWVHIPPEKLLAVYSKFLNGKEIIFHARIDEPAVELDGYKEVVVKRVRELNREPIVDAQGNVTGFEPATWTVYEEDVEKDKSGKETTTWVEIDSGDITIGIIPLVPVVLGKRDGTSWRVKPPLRNLVFMQVKLFQMENNLDCTKELTAFPMLSGEGISGVDSENKTIKVPVGPRAVLFAPVVGNNGNSGSWKFIEPSGASLTFLQTDIDKYKTEMRDLGYQPLTAANLTVITTANVSIKAHSAVQAWALMLKDALEQAWKITAMWLKQNDSEFTVNVHTDFGVDMEAGTEMTSLTALEANNVISKKLLFEESKRRGVLADDADYDEDQAQIAKEANNMALHPEKMIDPVTGAPIVVTPEPGVPNPPPRPKVKIKPGEKLVMQ